MIELGSEVRDKVSGLTGIVIAETRHLTGCITYAVQPPDKEGKRPDLDYFDAYRLEVIRTPQQTGIAVHPDAPWIPILVETADARSLEAKPAEHSTGPETRLLRA